MWPWKLEIALLFGIQVLPRESIRKVMPPPARGPSALCAGPSPAVATRATAASAEVAISRRRRETGKHGQGLGHDEILRFDGVRAGGRPGFLSVTRNAVAARRPAAMPAPAGADGELQCVDHGSGVRPDQERVMSRAPGDPRRRPCG